MKFSQRIGKVEASKIIQLESIDEELQNGLWNIIKLDFLNKLSKYNEYRTSQYEEFAILLWHDFYKFPIDTIPKDYEDIYILIRNWFYKVEWNEIYDFIEFVINLKILSYQIELLVSKLNQVLEREASGYRIIHGKVTPISNKIELEEVSDAQKQTSKLTALQGSNIHLANALELFSNKKNPDYRNSIKESISAVEATCRIITGEKTLGEALKKLDVKGLKINKELKSGFEKIYAYTNNKESGIRHAILVQPTEPDLYDAKYMLVACSSFINYLISKAIKIGLKIEN